MRSCLNAALFAVNFPSSSVNVRWHRRDFSPLIPSRRSLSFFFLSRRLRAVAPKQRPAAATDGAIYSQIDGWIGRAIMLAVIREIGFRRPAVKLTERNLIASFVLLFFFFLLAGMPLFAVSSSARSLSAA